MAGTGLNRVVIPAEITTSSIKDNHTVHTH